MSRSRARALLVGNSVDVEVSVLPAPPSGPKDFYGEKPTAWFRLDMLNEQAWDFGFVSSETLERLNAPDGGCWGITLPGHHAVLLSRDLAWKENRAKLEEVVLHELNHIAWNRPGTAARVFGGGSPKTTSDREEAAAEIHSVALARPLCAAGILRFPPVPRAAAGRRSR